MANQHGVNATSKTPRRARLVVGCGYLGERVARRWVADGSRVYGVTRRESRGAELARLGIEPIVADVTDAEATAWLDRLPAVDTVPPTFPRLTPAGVLPAADEDDLLQREHV